MKPVFIPHSTYQDFVIQQLQTHYVVLVKDDWPLIAKLWITDLSSITTKLCGLYGDREPEPRDPASMLRYFLLGLLTHPTEGITECVNILHRTPLYAILSGFEPEKVLGIDTFYDFFSRLWDSDKKQVTPKCKNKKKKKEKTKKGKKGEKTPTATPGRVKRLVEWILPRINQKRRCLPIDYSTSFNRKS